MKGGINVLEVLLGVWLFLLTGGVGFLIGRYGKRRKSGVRPKSTGQATEQAEFGWQELLNFLQYDGSGKPPIRHLERGEITSEAKVNTDAGERGVRSRRSV